MWIYNLDGYSSFQISIIRGKENGYNQKYWYSIFKQISLFAANSSETGRK